MTKPFAYATHHDEPMLFLTKEEAEMYCEDGEEPICLYTEPTTQEPVNQMLMDALYAGPSVEHALPFGAICQCSQCEFVRLRCAAIAAIKESLK